MRAEALKNLLGRTVKDVYGRYVGCVVGISVDSMGQLKSVGVEGGSGSFVECAGGRMIADGEALVLIPSYKIEVERLHREVELVRRRFKALDELLNSGEISKNIYDKLCNQYGEEFRKLQASHDTLTESLEKRVSDLEIQKESLERFLGSIKVQHRAGEMDDETFRLASDRMVSILAKNNREADDLTNTLKSLAAQKGNLHQANAVAQEGQGATVS